jgi:hypothetical protein
MPDLILRLIEHLADRLTGPLHLRLVVLPFAAGLLAIMDGADDAENRRLPYLWHLAKDARHRGEVLKDGWKSIGKIFIVALTLDAIYQLVVLRAFHAGEAILVAFVLAILPYAVLRGLVTRLVGKPRLSA